MSQEDRIEAHLKDHEKIHPNFRELVEKPVTIGWHRMNHMLGCSARWSRRFGEAMTQEEEALYRTLQTRLMVVTTLLEIKLVCMLRGRKVQ